MNLLEETIACLNNYGKFAEDIIWLGDNKSTISWDEFSRIANRDYDDGYGAANVNCNLYIVGNDWWIERGEYDGSEWWEFKTLPQKPAGTGKIEIFYPE